MRQLNLLAGLLISVLSSCYAYADNQGFGQTIQITTHLRSFVGKPTWLLEVRDVDNNQTIPYLFDITRGSNFWIALTYGRNYLITASRLKFNTYRSRYNIYRVHEINNFCQLESRGHINKGESIVVTLQGDLSPNPNSYTCHVMTYGDTQFSIAPSA